MRTIRARLGLVGALAVLLLATFATSASAHAILQGSEPANEQTLQTSPKHATLSFNENVSVPFGGAKVFGPDGARVDDGKARAVDRTVTIPFAADRQGTYAVSWRVISADGHPVRGAFVFHVGHASSGSVSKDRALAASSGSSTTGIAVGVARGIALLALLVAVGAGVFAAFVDPQARPRLLVPALLVLLAASAAAYVLDAANAGGFDLGEALRTSVLREQAATVYGRATLVHVAIAFLAIATVLFTGMRGRRARIAVAVVLVALAASQSLTGHAWAGSPRWYRVPLDMLHTVAAATWLGGLVQLGLAMRANEASDRTVRRYSTLALPAVAVLVVTGTLAAYAEIGLSLHALVSTTYGRLVMGKAALLLGAVALAAVNRQRFVPALGGEHDAPARRRLRSFVWGEVAMLVVVVALTAWLVGAVPAKNQVAPGIVDRTVQLPARSGTLQLVVDPAAVGRNAVHAYVLDRNGQPDASLTNLTITATDKGRGIGPLDLGLLNGGPGHFTTEDASIPFAGTWTFDARVQRGRFDEHDVTFTIDIAPTRPTSSN